MGHFPGQSEFLLFHGNNLTKIINDCFNLKLTIEEVKFRNQSIYVIVVTQISDFRVARFWG